MQLATDGRGKLQRYATARGCSHVRFGCDVEATVCRAARRTCELICVHGGVWTVRGLANVLVWPPCSLVASVCQGREAEAEVGLKLWFAGIKCEPSC